MRGVVIQISSSSAFGLNEIQDEEFQKPLRSLSLIFSLELYFDFEISKEFVKEEEGTEEKKDKTIDISKEKKKALEE